VAKNQSPLALAFEMKGKMLASELAIQIVGLGNEGRIPTQRKPWSGVQNDSWGNQGGFRDVSVNGLQRVLGESRGAL
jgi:hypothetical protein